MLNQRYGRVIQVFTCRLAVRKLVKCTVYKRCAGVLWMKVAPNRLNCLIRCCHLTQCLVYCWHGFCAPINVFCMHWSVMCPAAAQCYALLRNVLTLVFISYSIQVSSISLFCYLHNEPTGQLLQHYLLPLAEGDGFLFRVIGRNIGCFHMAHGTDRIKNR